MSAVDLNESRAPEVAAVIILFPILAALTVALRVYTRTVLAKRSFPEDYVIVSAMLSSTAMSISMGVSVINGFGRHFETVSPAELTTQLKAGIAGIFFYLLTHLFVKLSILLQYLRISVMPFEKRLCYVLIAFVVGQSISSILLQLNSCKPFEALWTHGLPGARCLNITAVFNAILILIIAEDVAILVFPAFILRHLSLRWYQKLCLAIVLSFGGLACIVSILRLTAVSSSTQAQDITYDKALDALYGAVEPNMGIICACVVTLRPFFRRHVPCVGHWLDKFGSRVATLNAWDNNNNNNEDDDDGVSTRMPRSEPGRGGGGRLEWVRGMQKAELAESGKSSPGGSSSQTIQVFDADP